MATNWLIYRHGSNRSNQHMIDRMPVAIVEAPSETEATRTERHGPPGRLDPYAPAYLALDTSVEIWANQRISAVPEADADPDDWNEIVTRGS